MEISPLPARTSSQTSLSSLKPPLPPSIAFNEAAPDMRLFRGTSLIEDVISLTKFFASLKAAARQLSARKQQLRPSKAARYVPAQSESRIPPALPTPQNEVLSTPYAEATTHLLANIRSRMWKTCAGPSSNCARMPTISEELDSDTARGTAIGSQRESQVAPAFVGPLIKKRGGMSALTSLAEEDEEEDERDHRSGAWESIEADSPIEFPASDGSFGEKWSDDFVLPSLSKEARAVSPNSQSALLIGMRLLVPRADCEAHCTLAPRDTFLPVQRRSGPIG